MDAIEHAREQWSARFPSLDVSPLAIFGRVRRVAFILQAMSDEVLQTYGITRADFDLLSALARNGRAMTPSEIAMETTTSAPGTTKRLKRLIDAGLIVREPNPEDGRGALVSITDDAEKFLSPVLHDISQLERNILNRLPDGLTGPSADVLTALQHATESQAHGDATP